jgi:hypothetical protein
MRGIHPAALYRLPVRIYRFDVPTFDQGIEPHPIDGVPVRIYSVARWEPLGPWQHGRSSKI